MTLSVLGEAEREPWPCAMGTQIPPHLRDYSRRNRPRRLRQVRWQETIKLVALEAPRIRILKSTSCSGTRLSTIQSADKEIMADINVHLFTDGACSGNPGPGGWAYILRHLKTGAEKEENGGENPSTNNRMELLAVIRGLEQLKRPCYVELFTDSVYVGKGLTEWMAKWKSNGWKRREGKQFKPIKNEDLWRQLDELVQRHQLKYTRVAGHSGHPENERCDELAVEGYQQYL